MIEVTVCVGSSCHLKGAYEVIQRFEKLIKEKGMEKEVDLKGSFCLGKCAQAVTVRIGEDYFISLTPGDVEELLEKIKSGFFEEE
jgi:NADH:ubiquinone oxidoreductase subunit E